VTYPTVYARAKDFTEETGAATDHVSINAELDALGLAINQLIANVKLIQRADNALANASVGTDQLVPGISVTVIEGSPEILQAKTDAETAADEAEAWAQTAEDTEVETGQYSALHWAAKSEAWADTAEDTEVETGKYSALHWAAKSEGFASAAVVRRNQLINGCFRLWQRATSQTSSAYGSDDRWINGHNGSTKTHSRQIFTPGQTDVPGEPTYFSRTVVTSSAGAGNYVVKVQRIEDVRTGAGQTVTLSFYAKADASKNMGVSLVQSFGTGGSPSSDVIAHAAKVALTTAWAKYTVTVTLPSITGKTLGSNNNSYLALSFWFDAGSTYNGYTDTLGQQSGTFDLAQVQLEINSLAGTFEDRPVAEELALCQRYYEAGLQPTLYIDTLSGATAGYGSQPFVVSKRAAPVMVASGWQYYQNGTPANFSLSLYGAVGGFYWTPTGFTNWRGWPGTGTWTADAEL
jgi:hypothetical protein